jgi:hypothetical protein
VFLEEHRDLFLIRPFAVTLSLTRNVSFDLSKLGLPLPGLASVASAYVDDADSEANPKNAGSLPFV